MENVDNQSLELIDKIECFARIFVQSARAFHSGSDTGELNSTTLIASYEKLDDALNGYQYINDHLVEIMINDSINLKKIFETC